MDERGSLEEALAEVLGEIVGELAGSDDYRDPRSIAAEAVAGHVVGLDWDEWVSFVGDIGSPAHVLAHLSVVKSADAPRRIGRVGIVPRRDRARERGARDPAIMAWLGTTMPRWALDERYAPLAHVFSPTDFRAFLDGHDLTTLEGLARAPLPQPVLTQLTLAIAADPPLAGAERFARMAACWDRSLLAEFPEESASLLQLASALDLLDEERVAWRDVLIHLTARQVRFPDLPSTEGAINELLTDGAVASIVQPLDGAAAAKLAERFPSMYRTVGERAPLQIAARLSAYWASSSGRTKRTAWDYDLRSALEMAPGRLVPFLAALAAHDLALGSPSEADRKWVNDWLTARSADKALMEVWQLIVLWSTERDEASRAGTEHRLLLLITEKPDLWTASLPAMLADSRWHALTLSLTFSMFGAGEIGKMLHCLAELPACAIASRALHLSQIITAKETLSTDAFEMLISYVARHGDQNTTFPHPLTLPSSTWIGNRAVEERLRSLIDAACRRFARRASQQLGLDEEPLTRDLFRDLERELEQFPGLPWMMRSGASPVPAIRIDYRQEAKRPEALTGVDAAVLLDVDIKDAIRLTTAELIQVKKPERRHEGGFAERWRIDVKQLRTLLESSPSSIYVLIVPTGEAFACPAKLLEGCIRGHSQDTQGTATIAYSQVRSGLITLAQFLTDLLLGLWLGGSERTVGIARGSDPSLLPLSLLTIHISRRRPDDERNL